MATLYGTRCADLLVALDLPLDSVVHGLMRELGVTHYEATVSAMDALQKSTARAIIEQQVRIVAS